MRNHTMGSNPILSARTKHMNKQDHYRQQYAKRNPTWKESTDIYHDQIGRYVTSKTKLLDIGCGHSYLLKDIYKRTSHTYGIDPDKHAITRNKLIKDVRQEYVEKMSFKDNFFDVVICAWVLEHLPNPKKAFKEIHRVLKPGGRVIFITPNTLNYNVWIIRLVPESLHDFFTRKLYGRQDHDTFSKKYRFNSPKKIDESMKEWGYVKEDLILNGDPSYISFDRITFEIACIIEKIQNLKPFRNSKVHIIGIFKKKEKARRKTT